MFFKFSSHCAGQLLPAASGEVLSAAGRARAAASNCLNQQIYKRQGLTYHACLSTPPQLIYNTLAGLIFKLHVIKSYGA